MRPTILHAILLLALSALPARGQAAPEPNDPFAAKQWHFATDAVAALEAWNYNGSHEELYGIDEGVTYGLRDGLVFRGTQRLVYVSQRSQDAVLLGLTMGVRGRVYRRARMTLFLQADLGISHTAVAAPPNGTRFNYLAMGGGGATIQIHPRVHFVPALQLIHVSNGQLKGRSRNPDIEAMGLSMGLLLKF